MRYSLLLILRSVAYFIIIIIATFFSFYFYTKNTGRTFTDFQDPEILAQLQNEYLLANIHGFVFLGMSLLLSFVWQLQSFFGKGVLRNYLTGRFHKPSVEERIFMFLDLNDATTLAEKLGPEKYSLFVTDFFRDLDGAITATKGQVFQYVGDEVVIIWKPEDGLKQGNCLRIYTEAEAIFEGRKTYYEETYGAFPRFKAGLHMGEVTITEIGVSKKEIAYHGDTINTTARICSAVHKLGKRLLISKYLYDKLTTDLNLVDVGEHQFKGKEQHIHLLGLG